MTSQQRRVLEIMQEADPEVTDRLFYVAASIIGIQPDEAFHPAARVSSDPSSLIF